MAESTIFNKIKEELLGMGLGLLITFAGLLTVSIIGGLI